MHRRLGDLRDRGWRRADRATTRTVRSDAGSGGGTLHVEHEPRRFSPHPQSGRPLGKRMVEGRVHLCYRVARDVELQPFLCAHARRIQGSTSGGCVQAVRPTQRPSSARRRITGSSPAAARNSVAASGIGYLTASSIRYLTASSIPWRCAAALSMSWYLLCAVRNLAAGTPHRWAFARSLFGELVAALGVWVLIVVDPGIPHRVFIAPASESKQFGPGAARFCL
jgi:hypothetical protein